MSVDSSQDLYGLPLDRFVPERTALVKALRVEKRREEASEVAALRRPSVAAWAVNQLVRGNPKGAHAIFATGDDLAEAQTKAASGKGGGDALRSANHQLRDAIAQLLQDADGLVGDGGPALSQTTLDRIGETLRAAAVDEEARSQVADGCLTQELQFVGLGIGGPALSPKEDKAKGATAKGATAKGAKTKGAKDGRAEAERIKTDPAKAERAKAEHAKAERAKAERAKAERAKAEREAERQRAAALKAARTQEAQARRAVTRTDKALTAAQTRRDAAAAELHDAEELLATAAQQAQDAAAELAAAEQARSAADQR